MIVTVLAAALLLVVVLLAVLAWLTGVARRLHRLHVRTDAARAGLVAAASRRAALARVAGVRTDGDGAAGQNRMTGALARLDRNALPAALVAELDEAEVLLVLARRVYDDAVRDTRAQRARRVVRWLRLAGTAPLPEYFDIVEPESARRLLDTG